jgi:hypothetical protein
MGSSGAASCSVKGSSGGIIDKRKRKKEAYLPAGTSYRYSLTGVIIPVRKYLQTFSSDLFAQRDGLCYCHVVCPGRYSCGSVSAVFTCGKKAYITKQKEETWIGSPPRRLTRYGVQN